MTSLQPTRITGTLKKPKQSKVLSLHIFPPLVNSAYQPTKWKYKKLFEAVRNPDFG